ncbi:MAG: exlusion protein FxsA [Rhodospirillaceae bacterium]|nr:exlusion protein FxsA [Rhodospirillaceae bacterium]
MTLTILIALIFLPIIEIAVLIALGGEIGIWNTIILIVVTALIGAWILRQQGLATLRDAHQSLGQQTFPVSALFDGVCLLLAGAFLLTPGFVTDALGFLICIPLVRRVLRNWAWITISRSSTHSEWTKHEKSPNGSYRNRETIDGSFREINPDTGLNATKNNLSDKNEN